MAAAIAQIGVPKKKINNGELALKVDMHAPMIRGSIEDQAKTRATLSACRYLRQ